VHRDEYDDDVDHTPRAESSRLAIILLALALLLSLAYNMFSAIRDRSNLQAARVNQQATLQQAERIRTQFDSITRRTVELAQQGNQGAAMIAEQLARRGLLKSGAGPTTSTPDASRPATK
jgi:hypothetical protein